MIPLTQTFVAGPEWKEYVIPFSAFGGMDGHDFMALLFVGGPVAGAFAFPGGRGEISLNDERRHLTMGYRAAADLVLVLHLAFVLFVVLGGLLVLRWPRLAWVHLPVALYGATIEFLGFVCPLTPLENSLRRAGGEAGYAGGFIDHYVTATLYPNGLTRGIQVVLGVAVLTLNAIVYAAWLRRMRRSPNDGRGVEEGPR
jgi:hypothetical protein